jgi:hypothetical protein
MRVCVGYFSCSFLSYLLPERCRQSSLVTDKQAKTGWLVAGALQSHIVLKGLSHEMDFHNVDEN